MAKPTARLAFYINHLYRKYAPLGAQHGLQLDLDLTSPDALVGNYRAVEEALEAYLSHSTNSHHPGHLIISDTKDSVIIKDDSLVLSPEERQKFTSDITSVKSRVGFGTTLTIQIIPPAP